MAFILLHVARAEARTTYNVYPTPSESSLHKTSNSHLWHLQVHNSYAGYGPGHGPGSPPPRRLVGGAWGCSGASGARRRGPGAESDDSLKVPNPLPPGGGTPIRKASLLGESGLALLLSAPLMSLLPLHENSRLVFRFWASLEFSQDCSSGMSIWHN